MILFLEHSQNTIIARDRWLCGFASRVACKLSHSPYRLAELDFSKVLCRPCRVQHQYSHAEFTMDPALEQRLEKIRTSPKLQSQQEASSHREYLKDNNANNCAVDPRRPLSSRRHASRFAV